MTTLRTAAQQALKALEDIGGEWGFTSQRTLPKRMEAITTLRAALAQPAPETMTPSELAASLKRGEKWKVIGCVGHDCEECQRRAHRPAPEPVAYRFQSAVGGWAYGSQPPLGSKYPVHPLYAAPLHRKPLSEEEIARICDAHWSLRQLARAVERAHGIIEPEIREDKS